MVTIVSSVTGSAFFLFLSLYMCGVIGDNIMIYVFVTGEKKIL